MAERERGRNRSGLGQERKKRNGPAVGLWAAGEKRKREREKGEMGWAETRERGRKKGFSIFENDSNTFI